MKIIISNFNKDLLDFIKTTFLNRLKLEFKSSIDDKRLIPFDLYLNKNKRTIFNLYSNKYKISTKNILLGSIENLSISVQGEKCVIEIDRNVKIPSLDVSYVRIAELVNYGNMELNPYPIYDTVFNKVSRDYYKLYDEYLNGGK